MNEDKVDAGRLHRIAKDVVDSAEQAHMKGQLDWYPEFVAWLEPLMGPCPRQELGSRAFENWTLAAMGALLAWGYFAEQLKEDVASEVVPGDRPGVPDGDNGGADSSASVGTAQRRVEPPTFAVLDAAGQPVIEGYRSTEESL